ncbi:MAG: NFACT RNA binding domain-containing protein [Candidatus Micrarchaeaceae archaeon]
MEIEIDFTKSAQENANEYYKKSKKLILKRNGAGKAIADLREKLHEIREKPSGNRERVVLIAAKREWYERFHWFFTSNGMLAIGGRDAQQNEQLNSRYFSDNDLFFHADVFGADVVILKDSIGSGRDIREEVAEFAACHSRAWRDGLRTADVYAMKRQQVSKSSSKGSLGTGSFLLSGERDWYRNVQLSLFMYVKDGTLHVAPQSTFNKIKHGIEKYVRISQGNHKKSDAAKSIGVKLLYNDIDAVMRQLPAGGFRIE